MTEVHNDAHVLDSEPSKSTPFNIHNADFDNSNTEIEKKEHISRQEKRRKLFESILFNRSICIQPINHIVYVIFGVLVPVLSSTVYTLIPVHNLFESPTHWYEFPLQVLGALVPSWVGMILFKCSFYMDVKYIRDMKHFLVMFFVVGSVLMATYLMEYIIWTLYLDYPYPVPFNGYIIAVVLWTTFNISLWFQFPRGWRKNEPFRKRLVHSIVAITLNQAVIFEYAVITIVMCTMPKNYQWIIAVFLPFIREFNLWLSLKWASKASWGDETSTRVVCTYAACTTHSLFLSYTMGSIATFATSIIILIGDFMINIGLSGWIVYIRKKNAESIEKPIELLQELVINEIVEMMIPVIYILCLTFAYFGPNSHLIGHVRNSYWQYNAIDDFEYTVVMIVIFFIVDVGSGIIGAALVRYFCQIKLHKVHVVLQNEFGSGFCFILAANVNGVRNVLYLDVVYIYFVHTILFHFALNNVFFYFQYFGLNMISSASDFTLEFAWLNRTLNNTVANTSATWF